MPKHWTSFDGKWWRVYRYGCFYGVYAHKENARECVKRLYKGEG